MKFKDFPQTPYKEKWKTAVDWLRASGNNRAIRPLKGLTVYDSSNKGLCDRLLVTLQKAVHRLDTGWTERVLNDPTKQKNAVKKAMLALASLEEEILEFCWIAVNKYPFRKNLISDITMQQKIKQLTKKIEAESAWISKTLGLADPISLKSAEKLIDNASNVASFELEVSNTVQKESLLDLLLRSGLLSLVATYKVAYGAKEEKETLVELKLKAKAAISSAEVNFLSKYSNGRSLEELTKYYCDLFEKELKIDKAPNHVETGMAVLDLLVLEEQETAKKRDLDRNLTESLKETLEKIAKLDPSVKMQLLEDLKKIN